MESLGLFNLIEEYIEKTNYKIDNVENLIAAMGDTSGDLLDTLKQLKYALIEHKMKLESVIDDLEYSQRSDFMFVAHYEKHHNKKLID